MNIFAKTVLGVALCATLSGCNLYKKYETPTDTPLTRSYAEALAQKPDSTAFGNVNWHQVFTDPILADLIDRALKNNTDLKNAKLNVDAAQAQLLGARLSYLPSLALAPNGAGAKYGSNDMGWSYQIPAQASWEIDVFAKILNSKRGAEVAVTRSKDYRQAVQSQIIAAVASTYYTLSAVQEQLVLSRNTSVLWGETVNTMQNLMEAGRTTEAAVKQSEANYYSILASITDLETSIDRLNNTMSLLLNEMPQEWTVRENASLSLPPMAANGVEMAWLAARPDVHAAEMGLAAAYYSTNSARAAFYPALTISVNGGFTNALGSMIVNPGDWFVQLAGSLVAPIFSRGRNIATLKAAKAAQQQALNSFEYAILNAAAEVSDALTVYRKSHEKAILLDKQVTDLDQAVSMTQDLFTFSTGSVDYLTVLTAQQSLLQAQINRIACSQAGNLAVINLYQALGGGREIVDAE